MNNFQTNIPQPYSEDVLQSTILLKKTDAFIRGREKSINKMCEDRYQNAQTNENRERYLKLKENVNNLANNVLKELKSLEERKNHIPYTFISENVSRLKENFEFKVIEFIQGKTTYERISEEIYRVTNRITENVTTSFKEFLD